VVGEGARRSAAALAVAVVVGAAGCSAGGGAGDEAAATSTTVVFEQSATDALAPGAPPRVDLVPVAVAALERQLGGVQQYFEINATPRLVNLFVALNNATVVQPWLYLDGQLTSQEGTPASGGTFEAAQLSFEPATVLDKVRSELPDATLQSFVVIGDGQGNVQYSVLVSSARGGGLEVVVGPDGSVKSVDPV